MKHKNLVILAMVISMIAFAAWGGRSGESSFSENEAASAVSTVEAQVPLVAAVNE